MKLHDLDPQWVVKDGKRVAFTFRSPTDARWRQLCKVVVASTREQWGWLGIGSDECRTTQTAKESFSWTIAGGIENASFEAMTVTPSIDGSAGGLWHGFIRGGEIVGGI